MWLKKLKKKKFQFILVGLMLCFTSAILAACVCFVAETKKFTNEYTSYEECPRIVAIADSQYDKSYFEQYEDLMRKTDRISFCNVTVLVNNLFFKGKQIKTNFSTIYHVEDINDFMHGLEMIEGSEVAPDKGEVWISSVCADSYHIKLGDKISIGSENGVELTVSGIVATLICPSQYMGTIPYYINASTAELFDGYDLCGISFFSKEEMSGNEYMKLLPEEFTVNAASMIESDGIKLSISYLADIFGGVGLLAAIIIFVVSLVIIKFIIMSNLANEYKEIGTYKALGFTNRQIIGFYTKSFIFAGGIGILTGAAISFPIAQYLCGMVLQNLGTFKLSALSVILAGASALLLIGMLIAGVLFSLKKICRITPVEAFSVGSPSSKKKVGHSLIKNAYSSFSVAINDIAWKRGASMVTVIVLTVSFYMSILFLSVNYSLERFDIMTGSWFSFPQYDAILSLNPDEDIETFLKQSEYVKQYVLSNLDIGMSGMRTDSDINENELYMEIYDDCSEEKLGIPLVSGRHPKALDEILMSYDLAKKAGICEGEWFHIENDTYSNDYLVTGLFSSMYNGGLNIIMNGSEYAKYDRPENYTSAMVFLKEGVKYGDFEGSVQAAFLDIGISETASFLEGSMNSLNSISKPLTTMFAIVFSLFSVMNIINLLIMNNIENRRQYGILKAMGFTNRYICTKNLLKNILLTSISAAVALLVHALFSQKLFFAIIHVNGLISNPSLALTVAALLFTIIVVITMMFTIPMIKVSPTELMEE
ncbi:MAG TPA: ABC transporter permease [Lachnospiraceae bacterium]|nr:ABC transporter permease [Lachnospiraceae bacterium]